MQRKHNTQGDNGERQSIWTESQQKISRLARLRSNHVLIVGDQQSLCSAVRAHFEELSAAEPLVARWQFWPTFLERLLGAADENALHDIAQELLDALECLPELPIGGSEAEPAHQSPIKDRSWLDMPAWLQPKTN
ncbi:MAG TPA: hypothetical protein V6D17_13390 [Candidatus Obscuribacterales bacterium]